jgi:hypothetical protein
VKSAARAVLPLVLIQAFLVVTAMVGQAAAQTEAPRSVSVVPSALEAFVADDAGYGEAELAVANRGGIPLNLEFSPDNSRLYCDPPIAYLLPGEGITVRVEFDGYGLSESGAYRVLVRSLSAVVAVVPVSPRLAPPADASSPTTARGTAAPRDALPRNAIVAEYYYSPSCAACLRFLEFEVPALERRIETDIRIERRDIIDPAIYASFREKMEKAGITERIFPVLIVGSVVLQGKGEIDGGAGRLFAEAAARSSAGSMAEPAGVAREDSGILVSTAPSGSRAGSSGSPSAARSLKLLKIGFFLLLAGMVAAVAMRIGPKAAAGNKGKRLWLIRAAAAVLFAALAILSLIV